MRNVDSLGEKGRKRRAGWRDGTAAAVRWTRTNYDEGLTACVGTTNAVFPRSNTGRTLSGGGNALSGLKTGRGVPATVCTWIELCCINAGVCSVPQTGGRFALEARISVEVAHDPL
ncbi:hypothetical protein CERSUDRAFT_114472 [Gelatoporia subvermispora B]|uniref:Uncharacterized protein n=1 Tax=Ceriporiopsis subvermispora (strain B) TaxID=914234 RepID=M2RH59_CERS8|nr:hypothetical protein CERSUDRAFT_114472 [Gelatoporia subvermispora B]